MKLFLLIIILSFHCVGSFSQMYSGHVINFESGQPVPYTNIGIIGKNIGTVSDASGWFNIELNAEFDKDTLCISCIGYDSKKYLIRDFKEDIRNIDQLKIQLLPKTYQLNEVLIKPIKTKIYMLGNFCEPDSPYGNAFYSDQLGTELGVLIKLPPKKNKAYLKNFRFYVGRFTFDKFTVKLNIYDLKNGLPNENILREPIFIELASANEYIIDLKKYNIIINGDFFISLEYFKICDGKEGELVFCAVHNKKINNNGFYRLTSQGNWIPEFSDNSGFSVEVECQK